MGKILRSFTVLSLLLFALLAPRVAFAFTPPAPSGAVTDTAGRLTADDDARLESNIAAYRARTQHQIAVLVVGSLEGESVEAVAYKTFNTWGIGRKDHDDGVLLLIAPNERKVRIETGKGIGDRLTDLAAGRILQERVIPELKKDRTGDAAMAGLLAIEDEIDRGGSVAARPAPAPASAAITIVVLVVFGLVALLPFVLLGLFLFHIGRRNRGGRAAGGYASSSSHDFGSSSSFSSDGGGFSGSSDFGGGSSGGGGASGSY